MKKVNFNLTHLALALGGLALALIAFRMGYSLTYSGIHRDPAAVQRAYDFSRLEGDALRIAVHGRLIEAAQVVKSQGDWGIELGSFQIKNQLGEVVSACDNYSTISLSFSGVGMFVNGEPPRMKAEGSCSDSDYLNRISPLMIPLSEIYRRPVRDQIFTDPKDPNFKVTFANVSDSWPHTWLLESVELQSENGDKTFVSRDEIKNILGKQLALELPQ